MADSKLPLNDFDTDFDLPPLPKLKTAEKPAAAPSVTAEKPAEKPRPRSSAVDILSAPNSSAPVPPPPKMTVDTTTVKQITSEQSLEETMAAAERALHKISENSRIPFGGVRDAELPKLKSKEEEALDEDIRQSQSPVDYTPDINNITVDEMDSKKNDNSARALKNMMMMDEMSMEMDDKPMLDDLSSEYTSLKDKAKGDAFARKETLSARERKALKDRMHEEIYSRPENFNMQREKYLENKILTENRIKRAKKGLLMTIISMFFTLCCAASTYVGLHEYNELFTYLAAGTVIAGLMLLIRSKNAKLFTTVYMSLNTLTLALPGFAMMILINRDNPVPDYGRYMIWFVICIALSAAALLLLSSSEAVKTYFNTDNEGNER